jgi:hypothetical protein
MRPPEKKRAKKFQSTYCLMLSIILLNFASVYYLSSKIEVREADALFLSSSPLR